MSGKDGATFIYYIVDDIKLGGGGASRNHRAFDRSLPGTSTIYKQLVK